MNNLVSIIMPAYNHAKYIQSTINSLISQTYKNIELIIIDDGSCDLTLQKINEMKKVCEKRFVRFVINSQQNQGIIPTLNSLLNTANGEYVFPMASDDIAAPNAIEEFWNFLSNNPDYALVVGENKLIDENDKPCFWDINKQIIYDKNEAFYFSYSDYLMKWATNINFFSDDFGSYPLLLLGNHIPNGYLIRKSIFEKTGYFTKEAPLEDYFIFLQIAKYAKMKYIAKPLFYYRLHDSNTMNQKPKMSLMAKKTRKYEMELVLKSKDAKTKKYMKDYINSFPMQYFIKIPLVLEVYRQKTTFFEQFVIKIFGLPIFTKKNFD